MEWSSWSSRDLDKQSRAKCTNLSLSLRCKRKREKVEANKRGVIGWLRCSAYKFGQSRASWSLHLGWLDTFRLDKGEGSVLSGGEVCGDWHVRMDHSVIKRCNTKRWWDDDKVWAHDTLYVGREQTKLGLHLVRGQNERHHSSTMYKTTQWACNELIPWRIYSKFTICNRNNLSKYRIW